MTNPTGLKTNPDQPLIYQIRVKGHFGEQWADWFSGLTITLAENGDSLLTGPVVDQAALYGLLKKFRDLGLTLISVIAINSGQPGEIDSKRSPHESNCL